MNLLFFFVSIFNLHAADTFPVVNPNVFYDKDGDAITILDTKTRANIEATKDIKANHVYDSQPEIEKYKTQYEKNVLTEKKKKQGVYVVKKGDQLKKISQKLYGTTTRWNELLLLNEGILKNANVQTGMKLKYYMEEKELTNGN